MADYKIIKYCAMCKKRFVVMKGQNKEIYCEACKKRLAEERENEPSE